MIETTNTTDVKLQDIDTLKTCIFCEKETTYHFADCIISGFICAKCLGDYMNGKNHMLPYDQSPIPYPIYPFQPYYGAKYEPKYEPIYDDRVTCDCKGEQ